MRLKPLPFSQFEFKVEGARLFADGKETFAPDGDYHVVDFKAYEIAVGALKKIAAQYEPESGVMIAEWALDELGEDNDFDPTVD